MSKITDLALSVARPVCESLGVYLWDVEFLREGGRQTLRFYIDRESGAGIDDCEAVSRALDSTERAGELSDLIDGTYSLEVSTPGMERVLRTTDHFERCLGERIELRLFSAADGKKTWTGTLTAHSPDSVTITCENGETREFPRESVSRVRLSPDFSKYFQD